MTNHEVELCHLILNVLKELGFRGHWDSVYYVLLCVPYAVSSPELSLPSSFLVLACEGWPMSRLMDLRVRGLNWPTVG